MPFTSESITAAEIIRNFGFWQQQALTRPLTVTHHGRARVMLISMDEYERLKGDQIVPRSEHVASSDQPSGKLDAVLASMAEGFVLFDAKLDILDVNGVAEAYFGQTRSQLTGLPVTAIFPDETDSVAIEWIRRVRRTGEIATFETASAQNADRKISVRVFPYRDQIACIFLNITEQERLREHAAEWKAACDVIGRHDGVSLAKLDGRGRVTSADADFTRFTGFEASELAHVKLFDIVAPSSRKRLQNAFEDVMLTRQCVHLDVTVMVKNGAERTLAFSLAPLMRDVSAYAVMALITDGAAHPAASAA